VPHIDIHILPPGVGVHKDLDVGVGEHVVGGVPGAQGVTPAGAWCFPAVCHADLLLKAVLSLRPVSEDANADGSDDSQSG
jgi:hypothetical protein